jgi:ABC-type nitrate/sulfonate/bicarbonate transport system permease component
MRYFPPFSRMIEALAREVGEPTFWSAVLDTVRGWGIGLLIALVAGTVVGFVLSSSKLLVRATASTIEFLRPIPSVALIPLAVLIFGTDLRSTLLLVVYAAFWPILIQVLHGVQDVDPVARDTASTYRFSKRAVFRHVVWPTCLPYLMTGVRLSASVALILAVTAELIIGSPGLGSEIALAQSSNAIPEVYAMVIMTGLLGIVVNLGVRGLERRVLSWHMSMRREVAS